jgi:HSP20 family protein
MVIDFRSFYDMSRQVDRLFSDLMRPNLLSQRAVSFPSVNVSEDENRIYVRAEIPGADKESLDVTMTDRSLTIKGEIAPVRGRFFRQERPFGPFQRIITVGPRVDPNGIQARMTDGILEIVLPKAEAEKPKKITIGSEQEGSR